jgi:cellulose synthase/poly-beta-1,6-N-acetylglucosamine synthase-like glycosyltransferase
VTIVFFVCALLLGYTVAGYPVLIRALAWLRPDPARRDPTPRPISIVLCARNEERGIADKLNNLLSMDYPAGMIEVVVVSDGSSDGTDAIVRAYADRQVRLLRSDVPRGKAAALNAGVSAASHDVLLMCDARQALDRRAATTLVSHFADERVGAVSGRLELQPSSETGAASGIGSYWSYEVRLRADESLSDSTIGVTGALYVLRKSAFSPLPEGTVLDDVLIPMRVVLNRMRVLFDIDAVAVDTKPVDDRGELTRKVRTLYGNLQLIALAPELLAPWSNRLWLRFVSHKILRLFLPFLLAGCLWAASLLGEF